MGMGITLTTGASNRYLPREDLLVGPMRGYLGACVMVSRRRASYAHS